LYQRLFESVEVGVAFVGPEDGMILRCNPTYARILGSTPELIEGRSFFEFLDEEQEAKARRERELRLRGVTSEYELTVAVDDGEEKRLLATGVPLYDECNGSYLGAAQTIQDVTGQRRAEEALKESEERYRLAFERAPVSMAHVSLDDGRFLRANDRFHEESGYGREELSELTWQDVTPPDDLGICMDGLRRALEAGLHSCSAERRYVKKGGLRVWIDLSVSVARGHAGDPDYLICIAEDTTERKLKELLPDPLTDRELEVLLRVAAGRSDPQVAEDLCYSQSTVKRDLRSVFCKLGVRDRRGAAEQAVEIGLIAPQAPASAGRLEI
jgi:PAS domain S-box-containing protein